MSKVLESMAQEGIATGLVTLCGRKIEFCDGCEACWETGKCHQKDDVPEILEKMGGADAIIIGSPVYFGSVSAQTKALMDRTVQIYNPSHGKRLDGKIGAAVAVGNRRTGGQEHAISLIHNYFLINGMLVVGDGASSCHFGAMGVADARGEIEKDAAALAAAQHLGKMVAKAMKSRK